MRDFRKESMRSHLIPLLFTALLAGGLTACSSPAESEPTEQEPQQTLEDEAGVTSAPGQASCSFEDPAWGTATVTETDSSYDVEFSGEAMVVPSESGSMLVNTVILATDEPGESVNLVSEWRDGELSMTGVVATPDGEMVQEELSTDAAVSDGTYSASFPKSSEALQNLQPTNWVADVLSAPAADGSTETVRCGDGRSWGWEPLP